MSRLSESRTRFDPPSWRCRPRLELLEDRWVPSAVRQFDFGRPGSETLRPGYTEVSESTSYDTTTGYGWLPGANRLESRDRGDDNGRDKLTRDFVLTRDGTFAVDLPNGLHSVTLTAGDADTVHGIQVYLEGNLVDTFITENDKYTTRTYTVNVQDGRLDLRLKELGFKDDDNAVINLLEIDTLVDPVFDQNLPERQTVRIPLQPHGLAVGSSLKYTLLNNSVPGAAINPSRGEIVWTPTPNADPGTYTFQVQVEDTADPTRSEVREFNVYLKSKLPSLFFAPPRTPVGVNDTVVFTGQFTTSRPLDEFTVLIRYGDGAIEGVALDDEGKFTVKHSYSAQFNYGPTVYVLDEETGQLIAFASRSVNVLPPGSLPKIFQTDTDTVSTGETIDLSAGFKTGETLSVKFTHNGSDNPEADVFIATYTASPVPTKRTGLFFDVQLNNHSTNDELVVTIRVPSEKFEFGYFTTGVTNPTWVRLLDPNNPLDTNNPLCRVIQLEEINGERFMTVALKLTRIPMNGTVFTVGLPPSGETATVTIRPAQASTGDASGQTRTLSFTSNAQLSLALTASRDNQLSVSSAARGSQAGESSGGNTSGAKLASALTSTGGVGGNHSDAKLEEMGKDDSASFWRWLQSDEGMLELWMQGIDPAVLLKQLGVGAEVSEPPMPMAVFETPMADLGDEAYHSEIAAPMEPHDGEPTDAPFIGLAFLPVLLAGQAHHRSRRRKAAEDEE